jgi:hypothetical protein
VLIGEAQGAPAELRAALAAHHVAIRRLMGDLLAAAKEEGVVRQEVDVDAQAALLVGTLRGVGQQVLIDADAFDVEKVTTEMLASTRRALQP